MNKKKKYFVHKSSCIDKNVKIGEGTQIWHFTHVMQNAIIGKNCMIGQNVFVDADVKIGNKVKIQNNVSVYYGVDIEDGVFLGPSCVFTNVINPRAIIKRDKSTYYKTKVEKGATIGANSTIVCGNNIGKHAFVGAGSVVTKDVNQYELVVGNPAKRIGWMCECGERIVKKKNEYNCTKCNKKYKDKKGCIEKIK